MSFFTKEVKSFQENFKIYAVVAVLWVICSLLLIGFTRQAWGGDAPSGPEILFCFGVMAMNFYTLYYVWLNSHLFLTRNKAGQKRDILEAEADQKYQR